MCALEVLARTRNVVAAVAFTGASLTFASDPASFDAAGEARSFLHAYAGLTASSDVAVLDLYRDDARLHVSSLGPGNEQHTASVRGRDWKRRLRAGWYDGRTQLEASSFRNVSIARRGDQIVIRADRYSQTRCYWDPNYLVVIEPGAHGNFEIVEERIAFQPDSRCANDVAREAAVPTQTPAPMQPRPPAMPGNAIPLLSNASPLPGQATPFHQSPQRR